jgi:uncharacterized protein YjbJ (UPF0337 family)
MENIQTSENRKIIVNEIQAKWGKFSDQDLAALKGKEDLVSQVQSRYKLDRAQAQKDVDTLLNGRAF